MLKITVNHYCVIYADLCCPASLQNNSETLATFSLPAGLAYPVQIPAGVTLQTASGTQ